MPEDSEKMRTHSDEDVEPPVTIPPTPEEADREVAADDEEHEEMRGSGASAANG